MVHQIQTEDQTCLKKFTCEERHDRENQESYRSGNHQNLRMASRNIVQLQRRAVASLKRRIMSSSKKSISSNPSVITCIEPKTIGPEHQAFIDPESWKIVPFAAAMAVASIFLTDSSFNDKSKNKISFEGRNQNMNSSTKCDGSANMAEAWNASVNPASEPRRNIMLHRMRSLRGRHLDDKYNVDWKTVLGEGAYGSVHPARLATTGQKVRY